MPISVAILLLLASASIAQQPPHFDSSAVATDWYSEGDGDIISLEHLKPDGSFRIEFRECFKTGARDHVETGHWSVSNNRLLMTTEMVRDNPVHLTSVLEAVSIDIYSMLIRIAGGDALRVFGPGEFKLVRVTADSKLPGCELTS